MNWGLLIPILAILMGPVMYLLYMHEMKLKHDFKLKDKGSVMQDERIMQLEQRMRVLERILTDGGVQTAAQIEALREAPVEFRAKDKVL